MPERFICENIRISTSASDGEALEEAARRLKKAGISRITELELHKKSLDARRRGIPVLYARLSPCARTEKISLMTHSRALL